MERLPDALFVVDVGYQKIAITEANKLGIPVIGVVDSNNTPLGVDYVIPGNDDSNRAIRLYARGLADAVLEGKPMVIEEMVAAGQDEYVEVDEASDADAELMLALRTVAGLHPGPIADRFTTPRSPGRFYLITELFRRIRKWRKSPHRMVKELRERTDAPMMDCKKALTEAAGDMQKAEEILRVRFGNKAAKSAGRVAAEGVVAINISADGKTAAMVEVNCETDFVAKNDDFLALSKALAEMVSNQNPADVAALSALPYGGKRSKNSRTELVGKIGENMSIRRFVRLAAQGKFASYIHGSKIGVLVDVSGDEAIAQGHRHAHRRLQAQVAGCLRRFAGSDRHRAPRRHREGQGSRQAGSHAGKDRRRHRAEVPQGSHAAVAALRQGRQADRRTGAEVQGSQCHGFMMFIVGEGIEKKVTDFAAEVAAASKV